MSKKIPLFKKDSDIFAHIFWVTLRASMTATGNTGVCTAVASAIEAYLSLIDARGKKNKKKGTKVEEHSRVPPLKLLIKRRTSCTATDTATLRVAHHYESSPCLRPPIVHLGHPTKQHAG